MSKNVFRAFKLDKPAVRAIRSDLASLVRDYIESHQWTQMVAAKNLGIPQPTVSNIMSGNTKRLTVDYLINLLDRLNIPWSARRWESADDACAGYGRNEALAWLGFRPCSVNAQNVPLSSRSGAVPVNIERVQTPMHCRIIRTVKRGELVPIVFAEMEPKTSGTELPN